MAAQKRVKFTTPVGTFIYPRLNKPDTKFKAEGEFSLKLRLPEADAQELIERLTGLYELNIKDTLVREKKKSVKKADFPWKQAMTKDANTGEEVEVTGFIDFKFSLKAHVAPKSGQAFDQRPGLFDAKGTPIPADVLIYGGTEGRVAGEVFPWYTAQLGAGISLWVKAVKVIKLVSGKGGDASSFGFDGEEEGYTADPSEFDANTEAGNVAADEASAGNAEAEF